MKTNYFIKCIFGLVAGSWITVSGQVNPSVFTEATAPVSVNGVAEEFPFLYEAAAAWGDYNNDGLLDLIIAGVGSEGEKTFFYENNGGNNFIGREHPFPALKQSCAVWFDYNNDGNLDLFLAGWAGTQRYSGLWKNKGSENNFEFEEVLSGTFIAVNNGGGNRSNRYIVAGDYDNDGWTDLYIQGQKGEDKNTRVSYLYRNINGERFELIDKPVKNQTGNPKPFIQLAGGSAAWGDYDGDGWLDLIASGEAIDPDQYDSDYGYHGSYNGAVYRNNGNGTFSEPIEFLGTEEGDVCWFDYNNDGKLDFTVTGVSWKDDWRWLGDVFLNEGTGFVGKEISVTGLPANKQSVSTAIGDVNNDGFEDILYMNASESDGVYLNNEGITSGNIMFTKYNFIYNEPNVSLRGGTANLVDYNNDGKLDAFLIGYGDSGESHARLMKNDSPTGNQAPGTPTNLQIMKGSNGIVMFSWDAPTDDHTPSAALKYNLYIKQGNNVRMTIPADITTGRLKVDEISGLVKRRTLYKVTGLEGDFEWGVQAVDNSKVAGPFAFYGNTDIESVPVSRLVKITGENRSIRIRSENRINGTVNIYTVTGMNLYSEKGEIDQVVNVPSGIYIVKVTLPEGSIAQKVMVK